MNLVQFLVDLNSLSGAAGAITSSGGKSPADVGSPLKLVHLDGSPIQQLGIVLAVPNIPNILRPGFDPNHPLASKMSPEGFEKITFAPGNTIADLPAQAQVVALSQTILGRAKDNINSDGCGLLTDSVAVLQMVQNSDGSISTTPFSAGGESTFLAIPVGGTPNTSSGFSGVRYIFDELWIVPSQAAVNLLRTDPNRFNALLGTQIAEADNVRRQLATVIAPRNPDTNPVRLHICRTSKALGCP